MKKYYFVIALISIAILIPSAVVVEGKEKRVDTDTIVSCAEFDPEVYKWQMSAQRWNEKAEMIKKYDWTKSCVNYIKYPVAK